MIRLGVLGGTCNRDGELRIHAKFLSENMKRGYLLVDDGFCGWKWTLISNINPTLWQALLFTTKDVGFLNWLSAVWVGSTELVLQAAAFQ